MEQRLYKAENIDLAFLKPSTRLGLEDFLKKAVSARPRGVCLNPVAIHDLTRKLFHLKDWEILLQCVVDFPLGQGGASRKIEDIWDVHEYDVVANIGYLVDDNFQMFCCELAPLLRLGKPVKIIMETGYYRDNYEILERALHWCAQIGAYAIKTSTGFIENIDNTTKLRHVEFWKNLIVKNCYKLKIKDSGGKKTREDIDASLAAGADIIGTSNFIY